MKKIIIVLISVVLVLVIGAGTCLALACAEPEEGVFADRMGAKGIDLKTWADGLFSGKICLPYETVNRTIQDMLDESAEEHEITGLLLAPSALEDALWMRAWVQYGGRDWVVTVEMQLHAVCGTQGVTGLELNPTNISLGKLPVPEILWPTMLRKLAEQSELTYEDGAIGCDLPDLDLKLVQIQDIRAESDGLVLELGMGSLWG